jgi:hypothetical protein
VRLIRVAPRKSTKLAGANNSKIVKSEKWGRFLN